MPITWRVNVGYGSMPLKKSVFRLALCCLGILIRLRCRLLALSRLIGEFDADATDLSKAMRTAGRAVDQGF